jgi:hypothetical protein
MPTPLHAITRLCELPPLILHPFNEQAPPATLIENSKASLMLHGLIPPDGAEPEELQRRVLAGRYAELRMLFFLGKDVCRWLDQCIECVERIPDLAGGRLAPQSFARLLTETPPPNVREKLMRWGVADYSAIFARGIGLNAVFAQPPEFALLSEVFLGSYHRYADALFRSFLASGTYAPAPADRFAFELYASGEYSRKLEMEWQAEEEH